jgi:hypothetical protein
LGRADRRPKDRLTRRIARWRRATKLLLITEALWPVIWAPLAVVGVYLCAALLDLPQRLGARINTALLVTDLVMAAIWLAVGLWRLHWPDDAAVRQRLQRASGLTHDPIAALEDTPAQTDAFARALWDIHRAQSVAALRTLRLGWPQGLGGRDRFALRGTVLVALAIALFVAGPAARSRLDRAFTLDTGLFWGSSVPPTVTAWITPPAYTGRPPVLLPASQGTISVPAGSRLTVTVSGVRRPPHLDAQAFQVLDASSFQHDSTLTRSGLLTLRGGGQRLAHWQISVAPDAPPTIAFTAPPGPDGTSASLRLPWRATDDYGVASAMMEARLQAHPDAPPLIQTLSLPDSATPTIAGVQVSDLSANPWAGLPVTLRLTARDALGQQGATTPVVMTLPERAFTDPFARRVIAIRKFLVMAPNIQESEGRDAAAHAILETAAEVSQAGKPASIVLPLAATGWLLVDDSQPAAVAEAIDRLWQVALHLEQGDAADTAQSLRAAQDALQQALQSKSPDAGQLSQLMKAVQAAVLQHLSTLMQMAQRQNGAIGAPSNGPRLDLSDLAQEMQAMEAAARAGDAQGMRDHLAALEKDLQALEQARVVKPDPAQQAARQQAMKDLAVLQGMMKQQSALMDHSARRLTSETPDPNGQRRDGVAQDALRRALHGLSSRLGTSVDGAGQSMGEATRQLNQGQDGAATAAQQQALTAMQQAANQLGQKLSRQSGQGAMMIGDGQSGEAPGDSSGDGLLPGDSGTDPFGRPLPTGHGSSLGSDIAVPDGSSQARLRAILQDLRARAGDRSRPQPELDYIDRLLQPF